MSRKQKLIYSLIGLVVLLVVLFVVSKLVAWREQAIGDITTQTNEAGTITIGVMNPSLITDKVVIIFAREEKHCRRRLHV